ncbi:unnamed protein product, partial [Prorocentrum cordatum]
SSPLPRWMLQRPPGAAGVQTLPEFTELPFAQALEMACRQLPRGSAHAAAAQRVLQLAMAPAPVLHRHSSKARALLLQAMGRVMHGDAAGLCRGLSAGLLPALRREAEAEARSQPGQVRQWLAAQTLFATLKAVLPAMDSAPVADTANQAHPVAAVWQEHWPVVVAAMLHWEPSPVDDEPLASASEALGLAATSLPGLLREAVGLLVRSACERELPDAQLRALMWVVRKATGNGLWSGISQHRSGVCVSQEG